VEVGRGSFIEEDLDAVSEPSLVVNMFLSGRIDEGVSNRSNRRL
jgi:hypothetical protein